MTLPAPSTSSSSRVHRSALAAALLLIFGLAFAPVSARSQMLVVFSPGLAEGGGDQGPYTNTDAKDGDVAGAPLAPQANGVTGVAYTGFQNFVDDNGTTTASSGNITALTINGTGTGTLGPTSDVALITYDFTITHDAIFGSNPSPLPTNPVTNSLRRNPFGPVTNLEPVGPTTPDPITITDWTLTLSITTDAGTTSPVNTLTGMGGTGSGTVMFPLAGADAGSALVSYSASLSFDYTIADGGEGAGAMITVTLPPGSIDFTAVPEPGTWAWLAVGTCAAACLPLLRARRRRVG